MKRPLGSRPPLDFTPIELLILRLIPPGRSVSIGWIANQLDKPMREVKGGIANLRWRGMLIRTSGRRVHLQPPREREEQSCP